MNTNSLHSINKNSTHLSPVFTESLRIGVLLCDHVRKHLQSVFGDYPVFFYNQLNRIAPHCTVVIYDITKNNFPKKTDECDIYIISGSKKSCYESIDWIIQLQDFIRQCHASNHPFIGICFGHQLISLALGGRVTRSSKGWGMSVHSYVIEKQQYIFDKLVIRVLVSHQDQVILPAPCSQTIGGSDFCPHAIITYGKHGISIQGHPEFPKRYSRTILDIRRSTIGEQTYHQALQDYEKEIDSDHIAQCLLQYHRLS